MGNSFFRIKGATIFICLGNVKTDRLETIGTDSANRQYWLSGPPSLILLQKVFLFIYLFLLTHPDPTQ